MFYLIIFVKKKKQNQKKKNNWLKEGHDLISGDQSVLNILVRF